MLGYRVKICSSELNARCGKRAHNGGRTIRCCALCTAHARITDLTTRFPDFTPALAPTRQAATATNGQKRSRLPSPTAVSPDDRTSVVYNERHARTLSRDTDPTSQTTQDVIDDVTRVIIYTQAPSRNDSSTVSIQLIYA